MTLLSLFSVSPIGGVRHLSHLHDDGWCLLYKMVDVKDSKDSMSMKYALYPPILLYIGGAGLRSRLDLPYQTKVYMAHGAYGPVRRRLFLVYLALIYGATVRSITCIRGGEGVINKILTYFCKLRYDPVLCKEG